MFARSISRFFDLSDETLNQDPPPYDIDIVVGGPLNTNFTHSKGDTKRLSAVNSYSNLSRCLHNIVLLSFLI